MKSSLLVLSFCLVSVFSAPIAQAANFSALEKTISKLERSGNKITTEWMDLSTGKVLFQHQAGQALNPASVIKLVTAYMALNHLGQDFKYKTEFYQSGDNLCVKGSGDPSTVGEEMFLIAQNLKKRGITSQPSKIILDDTIFDEEWIPEERTDSNSERAYNAPVGGLNFNYNSGTVEVARSNKGVECNLDWPHEQIKLDCSVKSGRNTSIELSKDTSKDGKETVRVRGTLGADENSWRKPFRVLNPSFTYGRALAVALEMWTGDSAKNVKTERGQCNSGKADPLFTWESRPLPQIVQLMNKYSNNFIADSLTKRFAVDFGKAKQGSTAKGAEWMRADLKGLGINTTVGGRNIESGSGLTRGNFLSASDFNKIWKHISDEGQLFPEFAASIPIAGIDGTLRRKYHDASSIGRLRGKTGSLNGVTSFSGLMPAGKGKWIAITWIQNGGAGIPEGEIAKVLSKGF